MRKNQQSRTLKRVLLTAITAAGLTVALVAPANAASVTVSGTLDGYWGTLTQYSTFRYHYSGPATLRPDYWDTYAPVGCGSWLRIGLRVSDGTQYSDTTEWSSGEMGVTKYFTRYGGTTIATGSYAFNGRTSASHSSWYCGDAGVISWNGYYVY